MESEILRSDKEYGIVVRTNAEEASKEELLNELEFLKRQYEKTVVKAGTGPVSAFFMKPSLFIWKQSGMCTAGIWKKS